MERFAILVPLVLLGIFGICYATFGSVQQSMLVMMLVPFAAVGGIAALWLREMPMNVSASVGFIAVFGIAIHRRPGAGLHHQPQARRRLLPQKRALSTRRRCGYDPVVMTSVVAAVGFLPMALATSLGSEVQRPLATVVIGGVISSTLLTLVLAPTFFPWFQGQARRRQAA